MCASALGAALAPEEAGPDWRDLAVCRGQTVLFFTPARERPSDRRRREAAARTVCLGCPVLWACRRWAREHREYGYWGAESEEERAAAGYCVDFPVGRVARAGRKWRQEVAATADALQGGGVPDVLAELPGP